jgi:hypothetical protein
MRRINCTCGTKLLLPVWSRLIFHRLLPPMRAVKLIVLPSSPRSQRLASRSPSCSSSLSCLLLPLLSPCLVLLPSACSSSLLAPSCPFWSSPSAPASSLAFASCLQSLLVYAPTIPPHRVRGRAVTYDFDQTIGTCGLMLHLQDPFDFIFCPRPSSVSFFPLSGASLSLLP